MINANSRRLFIGLFFLALAILACQGNASDACQAETDLSQVKIINMSPDMPQGSFTVVDSIKPTFRWSIDAPCVPYGWWVTISLLDDPNNQVITDKVDSVNNLEPTDPLPYFYTTIRELAPKTFYIFSLTPMGMNGEMAELYKEIYLFQTGPLCSADGSDAPIPQLLLPANAAEENIGDGSILIKWASDSSCVWSYDYQLSTKSDFSQLDRSGNLAGEMVNISAFANDDPEGPDNPIQECTTYYWRVRVNQPPLVGDWSSTSSFNTSQYNGESCVQAMSQNNTLPDVFGLVKLDTSCYSSPSSESPLVAILQQDRRVILEGSSQDGTWYEVFLKDTDLHCWVSALAVESEQDLSQLPHFTAMPLPEATATSTVTPRSNLIPFPNPTELFIPTATNTPSFCSLIKDKDRCNANISCYWWVNMATHVGYCLQK